MKYRNIIITASTVILVAIAAVVFYACKKDEETKNAALIKTGDNVEYMKIPDVDFSKIKKTTDKTGETILVFDSWEHYAKTIDDLLEFTYKYTDTYVNNILAQNKEIDEDVLNEILQKEGFYQFMPLYSVCKELQFKNSAFEKLRQEEIGWLQDLKASFDNPFDEMMLGYVQSALHNTSGNVMIAKTIFNPKANSTPDPAPVYTCLLNEATNNAAGNNGYWPTFQYDKKKRECRAFIHTNQSYSYAKTSVYYFNKFNNRIVWLCRVAANVNGKRLDYCDPDSPPQYTFNKTSSVFASVAEIYSWCQSFPNYLHPYGTPIVFSAHSCPGYSCTLNR